MRRPIHTALARLTGCLLVCLGIAFTATAAEGRPVAELFEQLTAATGDEYRRLRAELLRQEAAEQRLETLLADEGDWRRRVIADALLEQLRRPESFGRVAAIVDEAKAGGSRLSADDPSSLAIDLGVRRLGRPAIPEALEILVAGDESEKVRGALLRAVAGIAADADTDARATLCAFLDSAGAAHGEAFDPLRMEALEGLRLLGGSCPGAFELAVEIVASPAGDSYRYVAAQVAGQTGATQDEADRLFALLEGESDEAVRRALLRAVQQVQERCR